MDANLVVYVHLDEVVMTVKASGEELVHEAEIRLSEVVVIVQLISGNRG